MATSLFGGIAPLTPKRKPTGAPAGESGAQPTAPPTQTFAQLQQAGMARPAPQFPVLQAGMGYGGGGYGIGDNDVVNPRPAATPRPAPAPAPAPAAPRPTGVMPAPAVPTPVLKPAPQPVAPAPVYIPPTPVDPSTKPPIWVGPNVTPTPTSPPVVPGQGWGPPGKPGIPDLPTRPGGPTTPGGGAGGGGGTGGGGYTPPPAPTAPVPSFGTQARPDQLPGQLNTEILEALRNQFLNPTGYDEKAVQDQYGRLAGQIDDDYAVRRQQTDEEMARRGLFASTIGAGRLADLNIGQRSAQTELADRLMQERAQALAGGRANAITQAAGYDNTLFNQDQARQDAYLRALMQMWGLMGTDDLYFGDMVGV